MNDLREKVFEISTEVRKKGRYNKKTKYYAITELAINRGELVKLLSGDESYIYDNEGQRWLVPYCALNETKDSYSVINICESLDEIYSDSKRSEVIRKQFVEAFKEMTQGTGEQIYYAVKIYTWLTKAIANKKTHFRKVGLQEQLDENFRQYLINGILNSNIDFQTIKIFDCIDYSEGLFGYLKSISSSLERDYHKGFMRL